MGRKGKYANVPVMVERGCEYMKEKDKSNLIGKIFSEVYTLNMDAKYYLVFRSIQILIHQRNQWKTH